MFVKNEGYIEFYGQRFDLNTYVYEIVTYFNFSHISHI